MKKIVCLLVALLLAAAAVIGVSATAPTEEEILAERQQIALDYMREMVTVIWRATEDIDYLTAIKQDPNDVEPGTGLSRITLKAGRLYRGIPYSYSGSTGESFLDFGTDEDGDGIVEISGLSWRALNGNSAYYSRIGNDCSGALNHAWGRFGANNEFCKTRYYNAGHGYIKVGEYDDFGVTDYDSFILEDGTEGTEAICKLNGTDVIYEAYTHLRPADAIVQYKGGGHTMMIVSVDVVYTEEGQIDPNKSTVTTIHQSRGYSNTSAEDHYYDERFGEEVYQIGGVDDVFTFKKLFDTDYLPFTCKELRDPSPIPELKVEDSVTEYNGDTIVNGIISSNRIIDSATMTITDAKGDLVQQGTVYTQRLSETSFYGFNMRQFVDDAYYTKRGYINPYALPAGKYHCTVTVRITGNQTHTVRDFDFDWIPINQRTVDFAGRFCPMCGCDDIKWEPLQGGITAVTYLSGEHLHYYLDSDLSNSIFYRLSQEGTTVCLHLNGHKITSKQRVIEVPTDTTLNIMGDGTLAGANATTYKGAALDVFGRVNIFGGTYKLNKAMEFPVITTRAFYAQVDMYEGATVEGRTDVNTPSILLVQGSFNMHGGLVTGGQAENGGNFLVGYKTGDATDGSDTFTCQLNVFGGTIQNGTATGRGGNVYVTNEGAAAFYENALITGGKAANGGNIEAYNGGNIIINGSTVRDGYASSRGGNLYSYGIDVMSEIIVNDALIENGTAGSAGGNIEAFGGIVTLNNVTVRGGKTENSSTYGGNIDVRRGGTVTLNSGTVSDGYGVRRGGNICVTNKGVFIMNGGTVSGGSVGGTSTYGKSIFVYSGGSMIMNGGTVEPVVTDGGFGNGIYVYDNSVLTMAGDASVTGGQGIYFTGGGLLQVDNSFTGTASVRWADTKPSVGTALANTLGVCGTWADDVFIPGGTYTGTLYSDLSDGLIITGVAGVLTAEEPQPEPPAILEPAILKQPESIAVDSGETVQFKVDVQGDVVSCKWEYRKLYKWFNTAMTGYNTDTLTVDATGARNGYGYRCIITFADGTVLVSEEAKLTVKTYMNITYHPNNQVVVLGYKGQFTVAAEGEGIKYQWQYCRPDSEKWIDTAMEGCTKATVMIETTTARDGYRYRCKITDVTGNVVYSEVATMQVLSFTAHPTETFAAAGDTVTFTVETSVGEGFTYQWQYRRNAAAAWTNTTMDGNKTATLTVPAKGKNGYEYRCVLTGSKSSKLESKGAVLHVGDAVVISSQTEAVTVAAGEVATFTVEASDVYSYQWYYLKPGNTNWIATAADGNKTATLTVTNVKNGYQYRCEIKGLDGQTYYTEPATLTVQ